VKRWIVVTDPKLSLQTMRNAQRMSVKAVGMIKLPGPGRTLPPATSVAPLANPSAVQSSIRLSC
jgi:hypothetical protein